MSIPKENMPVYDDRVNYIIRSLAAGISREDLSKELRHRDYRSLDMYMRRRNFTWNRVEQNYVPRHTRLGNNQNEEIHSGKVSRIINAFAENKDPKTIGSEFGFESHKELAAYMTEKGYEWNANVNNYERKSGVVMEDDSDKVPIKENGIYNSNKGHMNGNGQSEVISLIKSLYEKLNIQVEDPIVDTVPRYLVKGIAKTKSVQMSHLLHQLLEDYSFEHNITQRQMVETAIIDFFRKYGYKNEVDILLNQ